MLLVLFVSLIAVHIYLLRSWTGIDSSISCQQICCSYVNVTGSMWCRSSDEAFLCRDLHGCSNVTAADDLAGVCPCNAACRCRCCRGSDDAADTHAQVPNTDSTYLLTSCISTFVWFEIFSEFSRLKTEDSFMLFTRTTLMPQTDLRRSGAL